MPFLKDFVSKSESPKKLKPLQLIKSSGSRYCKSPAPSRSAVNSHAKPLSIYHRRNITSIMHTPYRHSSSLRPDAIKYASDSCKGFNPSKPSKENQDTVFVHPTLSKDIKIFGVCDGHGLYGKEVSNFIASNLILQINGKPISVELFQTSIENIDKDLKICKFDVSYSGSTLVFCCIYKNILFSVNIGDSRAVLGRRGLIK